ncbi:MAG: hypothetical protein PVH30_07970 [Desulfobacterales bacterium]
MTSTNPMTPLKLLDPEMAEALTTAMSRPSSPLSPSLKADIVDNIMWSTSQEPHFGESVWAGYVELAAWGDAGAIRRFSRQIRRFGNHGPTQGRILAAHYVPVLKARRPPLERAFFDTVEVLLSKGTYLLEEPLRGLDRLLSEAAPDIAIDYLSLLRAAFGLPLSYRRCLRLSRLLPSAVLGMPAGRRPHLIRALIRLVRTDIRYGESFIEGLGKGLDRLDETAISAFIDTALTSPERSRPAPEPFLSLDTREARQRCEQLQVAVPLEAIRHRLERYLRARTGRTVRVKPLSALGGAGNTGPCTDGGAIYLPDEIGHLPSYSENARLYLSLVKAESGTLEFETYGFDIDRALAACSSAAMPPAASKRSAGSDLETFFEMFPIPDLARDLFAVFEAGRVRSRFECRYPGLASSVYSILIEEAKRMHQDADNHHPLFDAYLSIGLGNRRFREKGRHERHPGLSVRMEERFAAMAPEHMPVEACAELTAGFYTPMSQLCPRPYPPLEQAFGRRLRPDLFFSAHRDLYRRVDDIRRRLKARGLDIRRTPMVHRLMENGGRLSAEEVRKALLQAMPGATVEGLLAPEQAAADQFETADPVADPSRINWFEEWDTDAGDYRPRHVRVIDRPCESVDTTFYARTLSRHRDLVTRIRYAFELLKPEGLKRLRRWVDGDSLDYRQLIDVVLDRKAGLLPSDRIYTKRIKRTRDVSMLMLVDLSRSTSNIVTTDGSTVLDMEKEAIVLFSQALEVLGDRFAIAGFSGNGRLDVDYITVKGFDDPLTETVRNRISGLTSRRNTRMGAAIRRSRLDLDNAGSPVRLLILLSDGFPNDLGYKKQYAVEDTRKAIAEARATGITTHGITVNLPGHPRLDVLYGNTGHTVISDVKELPDRLMRVYGSLTRF